MKIVCVLGGTGFVGHSVVRQLSEAGYTVKVLTRNGQRGKHLTQLKNVQVIECNVFNNQALKQAIKSATAVINLIGILHESKKMSFEDTHATLPKRLAEICTELEILRLIHMSALQASSSAPSNYLRSKAKGEAEILKYMNKINITIFKPSVIFGACDNFLNLFAKLIKILPVILVAKPNAKFQPIYIEDVSVAFIRALEDKRTYGKTYELAGPNIYSLRELIQLVAKAMNKHRMIIGLNDRLSYLQAWAMELLPVKMMTRDNVRSMEVDSISHQSFPGYLDFKPKALEEVLPTYIH
jgi:NADH dehydrogenase